MRYLDDAERVRIGRRLLALKAELPRGHFGPWLRDRKDISISMAHKLMRLARDAAPA
jgi:hypothetical protein